MAKSKRKRKKFKRSLLKVREILFPSFYNNNHSSDMAKRFIFIACLFGASAVAFGAFGAHILKELLTESEIQTFNTGVEYQFYHTFAIFIAALLSRYTSKRWASVAGWLFVFGVLFFSGSLYLLAVSSKFGLESFKSILGPMTPLGGGLFILGWLSLLIASTVYKGRSNYRSQKYKSSKSRDREEVG